jgi:hypothetical protein
MAKRPKVCKVAKDLRSPTVFGKLRRDFNDLVRDHDGKLSTEKMGMLIGQWLVIKLILEQGHEIIANWDSLLVLFGVLIAPSVIKHILLSKYSAATAAPAK